MTTNTFSLSNNDKTKLLEIARTSIASFILNKTKIHISESELNSSLLANCGAFVTIHKKGELRGCIGRFTSNTPLYKTIQQLAISSATEDNRFQSIGTEELEKIHIEISVLSPLKKINSIDEIEMGKHGIYIKKGLSSGTFLPQVAEETGWTKDEFLGYCSKNKAQIGWEGWKNADIYIYEAIIFSE